MYSGLIGFPRRENAVWERSAVRYAAVAGDGVRVAYMPTTGETVVSAPGRLVFLRTDHSIAATLPVAGPLGVAPSVAFVPSSGLLFAVSQGSLSVVHPRTRRVLHSATLPLGSLSEVQTSLVYVPPIDAVLIASHGAPIVVDAATAAVRAGAPSLIRGAVAYSRATARVFGSGDGMILEYDPETWALAAAKSAGYAYATGIEAVATGITEHPSGQVIVGVGASDPHALRVVTPGVGGPVVAAGGSVGAVTRGLCYCPSDDSVYVAGGAAESVRIRAAAGFSAGPPDVPLGAEIEGVGYSPGAGVVYAVAASTETQKAWAISPTTHAVVATTTL